MSGDNDAVIHDAQRGDTRALAELRWLLQIGNHEASGPAFEEFIQRFVEDFAA